MNEIIDLFEESYKLYGDKVIMKHYKLSKGIYIRFEKSNIEYYTLSDIKQDRELYEWFCIREIMSQVISTNKAMDAKKQIISNNYLTLFTRVNKLEKAYQRLDDYFSSFENKKAEDIKKYIMSMWGDIISKISQMADDPKTKVKIFYKAEVNVYKDEELKYLKKKVFIDKYKEVEGKGVPSSFINMNSKKPYLEHKTRVTKAPLYVDTDRAIMIYKFKQFLDSIRWYKFIYIRHDQDFIDDVVITYPEQPCYFITIGWNKTGSYIQAYDSLPGEVFTPITVYNHLDDSEYVQGERKEIETYTFTTRSELEIFVDGMLSKQLISNYVKESEDIKIQDNELWNLILSSRTSFYDYFKKGHGEIDTIIKRYGMDIIEHLVKKGNDVKARKMMNLYYSLLDENQDIEGLKNDQISIARTYKKDKGRRASILDKEIFNKLYNEGKSIYYIAEKTGWAEATVTRWLKDVGKDTSIHGYGQKKIIQYDLKGQEIARFSSLTEANQKTGISISTLSHHLNGDTAKAGGFVWKKDSIT